MNVYRVKHDTSSSMYNPKSKGFAERNIQTVENIPQKCDDPYLAPVSLGSPAEVSGTPTENWKPDYAGVIGPLSTILTIGLV